MIVFIICDSVAIAYRAKKRIIKFMKKGIFIFILLIGFLLFGLYRLFVDIEENHVPIVTDSQKTSSMSIPSDSPSEASQIEFDSALISEESTALELVFDGEQPSESKINNFYFSHLSPEEQSLYRSFYDHVTLFENTIEIESYQFDKVTVHKVVKSMLCDSPELFWISESYRFYTNESDIVVRIEFPAEDREIIERTRREINAVAESWIQHASFLPTDYEKIKFIYEEIIRNTDYVLESENNQDIRSVFLQKQSVCAGYARAFQYVMDQMGIYNLFVNGEIVNGNLHAWNMVQLDEKYYWVDTTWGDPVFPTGSINDGTISYNYLCIPDSEIFRTHIPLFDTSGEIAPFYELPVCDSTDLDYYRLHENYLDTFDYDYIVNGILDSYWAGKDYYMVKCNSKELWDQIYSEISEGTLLSDVYRNIDANSDKSGTMTSFYFDEKMHTIKLILFSDTEQEQVSPG